MMKQRLFILFAFVGLVLVLVGLNAATYVQKVEKPDTEFQPNRSTYHPGATGTRAFYSLLEESGHSVTRWQQSTSDLANDSIQKPSTFIVIGPLPKGYSPEEYQHLLEWVSAGGRLVLIDRSPPSELLVTTADWIVTASEAPSTDLVLVDPADQHRMTDKVDAVRPLAPTLYTAGVTAIQPSRFASNLRFERVGDVELGRFVEEQAFEVDSEEASEHPPSAPSSVDQQDEPDQYDFYSGEPFGGKGDNAEMRPSPAPPAPVPTEPDPDDESNHLEVLLSDAAEHFYAPVVHFGSGDRNLVVDVPYGSGSIVFLVDPYIVANGGLSIVDNAQIAVNLATANDGLIAFDEHHHGYGTQNNRVLEYFQGTPVISILLQITAIVAFVMYSKSRRFARPVPEPEPDRLSKIEYVSAMAELQRRTRAFDLAMENIYAEFRRRVSRHFGIDGTQATRRELALKIAERTGMDPSEVEMVLAKSEDISYGDQTNKREVLRLVGELRNIEVLLRLVRSRRPGE